LCVGTISQTTLSYFSRNV